MSNDEFYEELRNTSKDYTDRYRSCKLLKDKNTGEVLLSTRNIEVIPYNTQDKYHRLKSQEICRLDVLAHKYYQNPLLWWIIAQANNITNPFICLESGTLLRIPSIETLYGNNGILL